MMCFFFLWQKASIFQEMCFRDTGIHLAFQPINSGVAQLLPIDQEHAAHLTACYVNFYWEDASESDPWEIIILLLPNGSFTYSAAAFINCSCDSNTCCSQHTQLHRKPTASAFIFRVHVKKKTKQMTSRPGMSKIQLLRQKVPILTTSGLPLFERFLLSTIFCHYFRSTSNKPKPSWLPRSDLNLVVLGWITKLHLQEIGQSSVLHLDLCLRNTVVWRTRNGNPLIQFPRKEGSKNK